MPFRPRCSATARHSAGRSPPPAKRGRSISMSQARSPAASVPGAATGADWRSVDLVEQRPVVTLRGERFVGHGKNVLGDPRVALTWLANELRGLGITLTAGEVVTTGTCHPPLPIQSGDRLEADFGAFGKVSVRLD